MNKEVKEILKKLSYKVKPFGIYDREDFEQQMWLILLENRLLEKYDPERGTLKAFLTVALLNEMRNLRRNYYLKSNKKRPFNDTLPITHETHVLLLEDGNQEEQAILNELRELCLKHLKDEARLIFLRLSEGLYVSPSDFRYLAKQVRELL